jgi:hypothetical protein
MIDLPQVLKDRHALAWRQALVVRPIRVIGFFEAFKDFDFAALKLELVHGFILPSRA